MSVPFHKQTDPSKQAGQVVFPPVAEGPGLALESGEFIPAQELTLSDYIARKQEEPQRITFNEWWFTTGGAGRLRHIEFAKEVWNAALKQGKL
jgi:hypothetical protein